MMRSFNWERALYVLLILILVMMIVDKAYDMYTTYHVLQEQERQISEVDQMLQQMKERMP